MQKATTPYLSQISSLTSSKEIKTLLIGSIAIGSIASIFFSLSTASKITGTTLSLGLAFKALNRRNDKTEPQNQDELKARYAEIKKPRNQETQQNEFIKQATTNYTDSPTLSYAEIQKMRSKLCSDIQNKMEENPDTPFKFNAPLSRQVIDAELDGMGLSVNWETGALCYKDNEGANVSNWLTSLDKDIFYIRHGKTYGNTEDPTNKKRQYGRIFQGNVDQEMNKLSDIGIDQAKKAGNTLLEQLGLQNQSSDSELINNVTLFSSPLSRAKQTLELACNEACQKYKIHTYGNLTEVDFGDVDNKRVIEIGDQHPMHQFYLNQNALVKGTNGLSMVESLIRIKYTIETICHQKDSKHKILIAGHSMTGACLSILTGDGKTEIISEAKLGIENPGSTIGFDGTLIMPNAKVVQLGKHKNPLN